MQGSSLMSPKPPSSLKRAVEQDETAVGKRLQREFGAPIGLLEPSSLAWKVRLGREPEDFPSAEEVYTSAMSLELFSNGRAQVWKSGKPRDPAWLLFPVTRVTGPSLLAVLGFDSGDDPSRSDGWGPRCPDKALRAWGQSIADQLRGESFPRTTPSSSPFRGEGGDRLLIARLVHRMRVSDAPEQFQKNAMKALLWSLSISAAAWVPASERERSLTAGDVPGLEDVDFRGIARETGDKPLRMATDAKIPGLESTATYVVVAADPEAKLGKLIAIHLGEDRRFERQEIELLQTVASLMGTQKINARLYFDIKDMFFGVIRALTAAIDAKDPYTRGHSERVARIAVKLAGELGMPAHEKNDLYLMGLMHDIGKIGIDDNVLKKTDKLTPEEYRMIQTHVEIGELILKDLRNLKHLLPGVRSHHESFDGCGYPDRLKGEDIPWVARILAVADAFDAMSSTRPYRARMSPLKIDDIFRNGSGTQWDPRVVDALFECRADVEEIVNQAQAVPGMSFENAVKSTVGRWTGELPR